MPVDIVAMALGESLNTLEMLDQTDGLEEERPETLYETIERLTKELQEANQCAILNWEALRLLINHCQDKGFDPYPDGYYDPLTKPVSQLTREELIQRNSEAAKRIAPKLQRNNPEALKPPTAEQLEEKYRPSERSAFFDLVNAASLNGGVLTKDSLQVIIDKHSKR